MSISDIDIKFMTQAMELAKHGVFTTAPNPSVGCVIVKNNIILGSGYHVKAGLPHAEICAMRNSQGCDLHGATAYVTLEPCSHYGLTPPCAKALVEAGVSRVVCATLDPNPLVSGNGVKILREAGVVVDVGVLEKDASELNKAFFYAMRKGRPYITVKLGMSLDGKVALKSGESKWITSVDSRKDVQKLRALNQVIMTSATTVLLDNPSLNIRYDELPRSMVLDYPRDMVRQPIKVVVDSKNKITGQENIFKDGGEVWLIKLSPDNNVYEFKFTDKAIVIQIRESEVENGHIDFDLLLAEHNHRKIRSILVEAGGKFASSLIKNGFVSEFIAYVAPKILGADAKSAFAVDSIEHLSEVKDMELSDVKQIGSDIRLTYKLGENS